MPLQILYRQDLIEKLLTLSPGMCVLNCCGQSKAFAVLPGADRRSIAQTVDSFLIENGLFGVIVLVYTWLPKTTEIRAYLVRASWDTVNLEVSYETLSLPEGPDLIDKSTRTVRFVVEELEKVGSTKDEPSIADC